MGKHRSTGQRAQFEWTFVLLGTALVLAGVVVLAYWQNGPRAISAPPSEAPTMTLTPMSSPGIPTPTLLPPTPSATPPSSQSSLQPSPSPAQKLVRYVVVPGDNLTTIAAKFKVNGWMPLYGWNTTAIGQDPNLIHPGLVLVVAINA